MAGTWRKMLRSSWDGPYILVIHRFNGSIYSLVLLFTSFIFKPTRHHTKTHQFSVSNQINFRLVIISWWEIKILNLQDRCILLFHRKLYLRCLCKKVSIINRLKSLQKDVPKLIKIQKRNITPLEHSNLIKDTKIDSEKCCFILSVYMCGKQLAWTYFS